MESALFDDDHFVSSAGLVPVMALAEQTGLPRLLAERVRIAAPQIKSGVGEPGTEVGHADRGDVRRARTASATSTSSAAAARRHCSTACTHRRR
jgi:hypothetical protein